MERESREDAGDRRQEAWQNSDDWTPGGMPSIKPPPPPTPNECAIAGLRELADFCETHPDFPAHKLSASTMLIYCTEKAEFVRLFAMLKGDKYAHGDYFGFKWQCGPLVVDVYCQHATVCTKIVTVEEVPATVIPAQRKKVIPAHTVEKVQWKCPDSVLALGNAS